MQLVQQLAITSAHQYRSIRVQGGIGQFPIRQAQKLTYLAGVLTNKVHRPI